MATQQPHGDIPPSARPPDGMRRFAVTWHDHADQQCEVEVDASHHIDALIGVANKHRADIPVGAHIAALELPQPVHEAVDEFSIYSPDDTSIVGKTMAAIRDLRRRVTELELINAADFAATRREAQNHRN